MSYRDLRDWLAQVEEFGEVQHLNGADWNLEMGALCDIVCRESPGEVPTLLFDEIKDYPPGYRALFAILSSPKRLSLTLGLPLEWEDMMAFVKAYRVKNKAMQLLTPRQVTSGPVCENVVEGNDVDLLKFPAPFHHEKDGGRYLGTAHVVIIRDPEEGWVNLGTYRCMVHSKDELGLHISSGKQGRIMQDKYFKNGKPMPVAVAIGVDPALWLASCMEVPWGVSEYEYAGALKGMPMEIMDGPYTSLPLPATAEIVIEGECLPGDLKPEGPFGEWAGYYSNRALKPVLEPVIHVKRIMYRDNPILTCAQPARPRHEHSFHRMIIRSALIWEELEQAGVPDVQGVWCHETGGSRQLNVVSIKQRYPGHSRQAGIIASQCHAGAYVGRYVVVVDEDIDPSNTYDVLWALSTRADPETAIQILRRCWSSSADPAMPMDAKERGAVFNSRAVIDACRPYEWRESFPPVAETSPEYRRRILEKWGKEILHGAGVDRTKVGRM